MCKFFPLLLRNEMILVQGSSLWVNTPSEREHASRPEFCSTKKSYLLDSVAVKMLISPFFITFLNANVTVLITICVSSVFGVQKAARCFPQSIGAQKWKCFYYLLEKPGAGFYAKLGFLHFFFFFLDPDMFFVLLWNVRALRPWLFAFGSDVLKMTRIYCWQSASVHQYRDFISIDARLLFLKLVFLFSWFLSCKYRPDMSEPVPPLFQY